MVDKEALEQTVLKNMDEARLLQKGSVLQEAVRLDCDLVRVEDLARTDQALEHAKDNALAPLLGGKLRIDSVQVFTFRSRGVRHHYFQPFSGGIPLPGEHHAQLPGGLGASLVLESQGSLAGQPDYTWRCTDQDLAAAFRSNRDLKKSIGRLQGTWSVGRGQIKIPWALQVRAVDESTCHLVMRPGRYLGGGIGIFKVGLAHFLALWGHLERMLQPSKATPGGDFPVETAFQWPAETANGDIQHPAQHQDLSAVITATLRDRPEKWVLGPPIPAKKEAQIRRHVLPARAADEALVAAVDLGWMLTSARKALAFSGTHCYLATDDSRVYFPLDAVEMVEAPQGKFLGRLVVWVAGLGRILLPCGKRAGLVHEVLERVIAEQNR